MCRNWDYFCTSLLLIGLRKSDDACSRHLYRASSPSRAGHVSVRVRVRARASRVRVRVSGGLRFKSRHSCGLQFLTGKR